VTPAARKLLTLIAREVGKLDNRVVIEGHTDARPYRYEKFYSNWELSTDRANAARRVMEAGGLWKGQVAEVRGYAATRLRVPSDPFHYSNRRVSLLIPYRSQ
jgi:chemotaxis protein MotB